MLKAMGKWTIAGWTGVLVNVSKLFLSSEWNNILAVEFGNRLTDLPREFGLKIGCERHVDVRLEVEAKVTTLTMNGQSEEDFKLSVKKDVVLDRWQMNQTAWEGTKWHEDQSGKNQIIFIERDPEMVQTRPTGPPLGAV